MKLSKRLQYCTDYLTNYKRVADVGTDHAQVPAYLLLNNSMQKVLISDNKSGPLKRAKETLEKYNLSNNNNAKLLLADGINHDEFLDIEACLIAGMGGNTIIQIIKQSLDIAKKFDSLIMQPNEDADKLRKYLNDNNFKIISERALYDNDKFYTIINASYEKDIKIKTLTKEEIFFGPILKVEKSIDYMTFWNRRYKMLSDILKQLPPNHTRIIDIKTELQLIEKEGILI